MEYEVNDFLKEDENIELNERIDKGYMALMWCICMKNTVEESIQLFGL